MFFLSESVFVVTEPYVVILNQPLRAFQNDDWLLPRLRVRDPSNF